MRHYSQNPKLLMCFAPFRALSVSAAYITPFFLEKGMSMTEIFVLQSIFSIAYVAWEVVSGWFADTIGRAKAVKLSVPVASLAMLAYGFSDHFWQFVICELLLAFANGLISGADTALLVDSLKADDSQDEYVKIDQRIKAFGFAAIALGMPVSYLLVKYIGISSTLIADAVLTMIGGYFVYQLVEPPIHDTEELHADTAWRATRRLLASKETRWLIALGISLSTSTYIAYWLAAPYYTQIGIPVAWFGALLAVRSLFKAVLSWRFHSERHVKYAMAVFVVLAGLPYMFMATGAWWLLWAVLGHDIVQALHDSPLSHRLNAQMPSRYRAMLNSVVGLQRRLAYFAVGPLAGLLIDRAGLSEGFIVLGICFTSVSAVAYWRLLRLGSFDKGR